MSVPGELHALVERFERDRASYRSGQYNEAQENGRIRYWGYVGEIGKYLRVVTLEDGETVHNAMPDRNYTRKQRRET